MKLALAAFAVACLSFGVDATAAVRGANDADVEPEPAVVRMLDGDEGEGPEVGKVTLDMVDPKAAGGIDADHFYKPYKTGSCACAADAYLAVYKAGGACLKMVPLVIATDDSSGTEVEVVENSIFVKIQREISRLLDFAVCFLHSIDCGCDDAPYGKLPVKHFGQFAVSTYQCCCDVNAIRDLIINGIKELSQWQTTMGQDPEYPNDATKMATIVDQGLVHKRKQYHVLENIVQTVYKNALEIGEVYTEHGEDCLEAICATDDSLFDPTFPVGFTDLKSLGQYACFAEPPAAAGGAVAEDWYKPHTTDAPSPPLALSDCVRVCDEKGKSACVINIALSTQTCSSDVKCAPNFVCVSGACKPECNVVAP